MNYQFGIKPLIIFELAGNHNGKIEKAMKLIDEIYRISNDEKYKEVFDFGIKTQYRNLESFIHFAYKDDFNFKYIKRFTETRLDNKDYEMIHRVNKNRGFITITTPFDEPSVDLAVEHNIDIIKVASCSFDDWPLLNKISETDKPIILSTATARITGIDKVVMFFKHRNKSFALLHCTAEYPTSKECVQLNQIELLKNRYPDISIGFSAHESIDSYTSADSILKNVKIIEFHYGLTGELNSYSKDKFAVSAWLEKLYDNYIKCGVGVDERYVSSDKELSDLSGLKRCAYAKRDINKGEIITRNDINFCIPNLGNGHLFASDFSKYNEITAISDMKMDEPVYNKDVEINNIRDAVLEIHSQIKDILKEGNIHLPKNSVNFTISHHYGFDKFGETGATIIDIINREYCKKIIVLLQGQNHPEHYHKLKEEVFHVLHGSMILKLNGKEEELLQGDMIVINKNDIHGFSSVDGCVFEELSSHHYKDDSYYSDPKITENRFRKLDIML